MTSETLRNSTNHQIGLSTQGTFYSKKNPKQTKKNLPQQPQLMRRPDLIYLIDLEIFECKFIILLLTIIIIGLYQEPINLLN